MGEVCLAIQKTCAAFSPPVNRVNSCRFALRDYWSPRRLKTQRSTDIFHTETKTPQRGGNVSQPVLNLVVWQRYKSNQQDCVCVCVSVCVMAVEAG